MKKRLFPIIAFTLVICIILTTIIVAIQITAENKIEKGCSYLDPITIDLLAFTASLFLIIEGFAKIIKNPKEKFKIQLFRTTRIAIGFAIFTLHTLQFMHK